MSVPARLHEALPHVPNDIVDAIATEFVNLNSRFLNMDWGPAKLNGGRLAEAILRFLEWLDSGGNYTPIGTPLNRNAILRRVNNNTSIQDGLRIHVTKCVEILMDIRNRRDVAHIGAVIDVNEMAAQLVMRLSSWILSEIIRDQSDLQPDDIQKMIDELSIKNVPLVEEIAGDLTVVAKNFNATQRALIALYSKYPIPLDIKTLQAAVGYKNFTNFRKLIESQTKQGIVHSKNDQVYLSHKGVMWIEKNIEMEINIDG